MEEIKRNPLPAMECGMAYLAHPYAPYAPAFLLSMRIHSWKEKIWKKRRFSGMISDFSITALF